MERRSATRAASPNGIVTIGWEEARVTEVFNVVVVVSLVLVVIVMWARHAIYRSRFYLCDDDLERARREAVRGSHVTKGGQIAEQLAPMLPGFCESFNPKDARFLGHPIDFVVFDGLEEGDVQSVVLLEIKSGTGADLNKRQRQVKRAIDAGNVRFETLRLASFSEQF